MCSSWFSFVKLLRVKKHCCMFPSKVDLALPVSKVHFDLTSVLTTLAQNAVIMETKGLTRCLLSETTTKTGEKETVLNTEGINMNEMFSHSNVSTPSLSQDTSYYFALTHVIKWHYIVQVTVINN